MLWFLGVAVSFVGLLWIGSGAFGSNIDADRRGWVMSRASVLVVIGLALMFGGTVFSGEADRFRMAVDVVVALLLAALIVVHFSRSDDAAA
jgi:drug/metabolite transporter (DMT)-like permease